MYPPWEAPPTPSVSAVATLGGTCGNQGSEWRVLGTVLPGLLLGGGPLETRAYEQQRCRLPPLRQPPYGGLGSTAVSPKPPWRPGKLRWQPSPGASELKGSIPGRPVGGQGGRKYSGLSLVTCAVYVRWVQMLSIPHPSRLSPLLAAALWAVLGPDGDLLLDCGHRRATVLRCLPGGRNPWRAPFHKRKPGLGRLGGSVG